MMNIAECSLNTSALIASSSVHGHSKERPKRDDPVSSDFEQNVLLN